MAPPSCPAVLEIKSPSKVVIAPSLYKPPPKISAVFDIKSAFTVSISELPTLYKPPPLNFA